MKILVTGRGGAASWTIRGEQIGRELGATVIANASIHDMRAHDVVLVVKRVPPEMRNSLKRSGRPWVYDIVDAYPQKSGAMWTRANCMRWLANELLELRPNSVIWPNTKMREDFNSNIGALRFADGGHVIYHHARPGIELNPIREIFGAIAYEGSERYLDDWAVTIAKECEHRGLRFLINPPSLANADAVVAVRGGQWVSYASRNWKSNVKLANAHASGTPFIGPREAGYLETASGAEYWADTPAEFRTALDWLIGQEGRLAVQARFLPCRISLQTAAGQVAEALKCAAKS